MLRWTAFGLILAGQAAAGGLEISMADGDPHDRIWLRNHVDCEIIAGALVLDFRGSEGQIVIDTAYGGVGTKDPMPVEVEVGNISVVPVADGDQEITILMGGIAPGGEAVVTLDFDNGGNNWFSQRVSILSKNVVGTVARFETPQGQMSARFESGARLELGLPDGACEDQQDEPVVTPVS